MLGLDVSLAKVLASERSRTELTLEADARLGREVESGVSLEVFLARTQAAIRGISCSTRTERLEEESRSREQQTSHREWKAARTDGPVE